MAILLVRWSVKTKLSAAGGPPGASRDHDRRTGDDSVTVIEDRIEQQAGDDPQQADVAPAQSGAAGDERGKGHIRRDLGKPRPVAAERQLLFAVDQHGAA